VGILVTQIYKISIGTCLQAISLPRLSGLCFRKSISPVLQRTFVPIELNMIFRIGLCYDVGPMANVIEDYLERGKVIILWFAHRPCGWSRCPRSRSCGPL